MGTQWSVSAADVVRKGDAVSVSTGPFRRDGVDPTVPLSVARLPTAHRCAVPSGVVIPSGYSSVVITVTTATVNATVTGTATNYTTGTCGVTITP